MRKGLELFLKTRRRERIKFELVWYYHFSHELSNSCRIWIGPKAGYGYGRISYSGFGEYRVHRWAYVLFSRRAIPRRMNVLHTCDNRMCINYDHLFLGTQQTNVIDMHRKHRWKIDVLKAQKRRRQWVQHSKLHEVVRKKIRRLYNNGQGIVQGKLSRRFHVTQSTISKIVNEKGSSIHVS